jgi:hypothetical protein
MARKSGTPKARITWNGAKGAKRMRLSVGKDPADAGARRLRKEAGLNAVNSGIAVAPENGTNGHRSLNMAT